MTYKPLSSGKITPERSTKYDARKIMGVRGRLGGAFFITMEDANKMTRSLFTLRLRIHLSTKLTLQKKKMKKKQYAEDIYPVEYIMQQKTHFGKIPWRKKYRPIFLRLSSEQKFFENSAP